MRVAVLSEDLCYFPRECYGYVYFTEFPLYVERGGPPEERTTYESCFQRQSRYRRVICLARVLV
jgi:hypothetical protein